MLVIILTMMAVAQDVTIAASGPGKVRVKATAEPVFVPACRGVSWSVFDADSGQFEGTAPSACGPLSVAVKVGPEGHEFTLDAALPRLPDVGFYVVIPSIVYGKKCKEETPFPLASCAQTETIKGPQMVVRPRDEAAAVSDSIAE